jgi:hypothetical protein
MKISALVMTAAAILSASAPAIAGNYSDFRTRCIFTNSDAKVLVDNVCEQSGTTSKNGGTMQLVWEDNTIMSFKYGQLADGSQVCPKHRMFAMSVDGVCGRMGARRVAAEDSKAVMICVEYRKGLVCWQQDELIPTPYY